MKSDLQELRKQLRAKRRNMDARQHCQASEDAVSHITRHRLFRAARHIACYLPNDGELDLGDLILRCWELGKTVYLPVLSHIHHNHLLFLPFYPGDELVMNRFGIPEPPMRARRMFHPRRIDLVLAPLVGFDMAGNRLGMGGGFYDRTFAFLRRRRFWCKPHLLGVAFDLQQVSNETRLQGRPWDVPLRGVATESGIKLFSGRQ